MPNKQFKSAKIAYTLQEKKGKPKDRDREGKRKRKKTKSNCVAIILSML